MFENVNTIEDLDELTIEELAENIIAMSASKEQGNEEFFNNSCGALSARVASASAAFYRFESNYHNAESRLAKAQLVLAGALAAGNMAAIAGAAAIVATASAGVSQAQADMAAAGSRVGEAQSALADCLSQNNG